MKIAVTSQNFRTVTGHAGRARRFLIYDAEPGAEPVEASRLDLPKELAMHEFHGTGPHPIDDVDVILSQGFGDGFARRMAKRGIAAFETDRTDPIEAVKAYLERPQRETEPRVAASCGGGLGHAHAHRHHHGHEAMGCTEP
jgi:predicted Fe-Mo cluster-binding NifX family protein